MPAWAQYDRKCERCRGNGRLWRLDRDGTAEPCPDCRCWDPDPLPADEEHDAADDGQDDQHEKESLHGHQIPPPSEG